MKLMEVVHIKGLQAWAIRPLYILSIHLLVEPLSSDYER